MSKFPFQLAPGLVSDDTRLLAKGRYSDGSNVRFWEGLPEVIGGWEAITSTALTGVCRSVFQWADKASTINIGFGTHSALMQWSGGLLSDITPLYALPAVTLAANPLTVATGLPTVTVAQNGHPYIVGDPVTISGATAVGGITPNGSFTVATATTNTWTYTFTSNATGNATGGGSAVVISPTRAFTAGAIDGTGGAGFGTGSFGVGTFSSPSTSDYYPRTWSMGAWGENLVACPRGGTIYQWTNNAASKATAVAGAPSKVKAIMVSATDQLFALGCNEEVSGVYNPMCLRHSSVRNITQWTTGASTTAREYILPGGGEIVMGKTCGPYLLIWTTHALFVGTFVGNLGQPWRFDRVGERCGLIGPQACMVVGQRAVWLSPDLQFRSYALGGDVQIIECPIRKDMVANITASQSDKVVASGISKYNEVRFDYPDARDGFENSRYLAVSLEDGAWYRGQMARTAMCDAAPSENPIGVTYDGYAYWHERGNSADGAPFSWYIESSEVYLDESITTMVRGLWPDVSNQVGPWNLTLFTRLKPQGEVRTFGPYSIAATDYKTDIRASGRLFRMRFSGNAAPTGGRMGRPIFDTQPSSKR